MLSGWCKYIASTGQHNGVYIDKTNNPYSTHIVLNLELIIYAHDLRMLHLWYNSQPIANNFLQLWYIIILAIK